MSADILDLVLNRQYECMLIDLPRTVRSDVPFSPRMVAKPGRYMGFFNQHGAASVYIEEAGKLLGVKPDEFTFASEPGRGHLDLRMTAKYLRAHEPDFCASLGADDEDP